MEELHRIHKDVPFGYWVDGVMPLYRWLLRKWVARRSTARWSPSRTASGRR